MAPARRDLLILAGILIVGTVLRCANLPGRGEWDDDQGGELLDMMRWVRDGQVPLRGPVGSFGTAHHGVGFYYLLVPGAFLTDADPVAAVTTLMLIGVAGVAATWWLGRIVGGPVAGHIAGLLAAVSPSAIGASTFVWNSNIVGPAAALATASAWQAWRTRQPWWWTASAAGLVLVAHGHLLAALLAVPLAVLFGADLLRRSHADRRGMALPVSGVVGVVVLGFVPLLIHELRHDFSETRALVDFATGAGSFRQPVAPQGLPITAMPAIAWRLLVWPLSGLVSAAPVWGIPAAVLTLTALVVASTGPDGTRRQFGRWAAAATAWAVLALTLTSPTLAIVTPGLPNDQYHAWLDPILIAAAGVAIARLAAAQRHRARLAAIAVTAAALVLCGLSFPPLVHPGGGWTAARAAAARVAAVADGRPMAVVGVATKTAASLEFPLRRARAPITSPEAAEVLVVACDPRFEEAAGMPCDGRAEYALAARLGFIRGRVLDRFTNGPRRVVTVFARS